MKHVLGLTLFNSCEFPVTYHLAFPSAIRRPAALVAEMWILRSLLTPFAPSHPDPNCDVSSPTYLMVPVSVCGYFASISSPPPSTSYC